MKALETRTLFSGFTYNDRNKQLVLHKERLKNAKNMVDSRAPEAIQYARNNSPERKSIQKLGRNIIYS